MGKYVVPEVKFPAAITVLPHCSVQWGNYISMPIDAVTRQIPFNITMPGYLWSGATINSGDIPDIVITPYIQQADQNGLLILIDYETGKLYTPGSSYANILWIAIGVNNR